jgi:hypothetical protein
MAAMSNFLENKLIDWLFRGQAIGITGASAGATSGPTALYVALFTSATSLTDAGGGTEVSTTGTNYARALITSGLGAWAGTSVSTGGSVSSGTDGTTSNVSAITFNAPGGTAWGTIQYFGIFDAVTGGNMLIYGQLTTNKTVNANDAAPAFSANALSIQIDN